MHKLMRVKLHTLPITFHRKNLKIDKKKVKETQFMRKSKNENEYETDDCKKSNHNRQVDKILTHDSDMVFFSLSLLSIFINH